MRRRHRRGSLRGQLIELGRGDALVDARGDLLGDENLDVVFFFRFVDCQATGEGRVGSE